MRVVRKNVRGYWGMNHEAGRELNIKNTPDKNTIFVDKSLKGERLKKVVAHEKVESFLMREKGLKYKDAHRIANRFERNVR